MPVLNTMFSPSALGSFFCVLPLRWRFRNPGVAVAGTMSVASALHGPISFQDVVSLFIEMTLVVGYHITNVDDMLISDDF